jgi:signal transduction histidine kinase
VTKFRDLSISQKISRSILLTSVFSLALAATATVIYELSYFRKAAMDDLVTTAEIVAANSSGALSFDDVEAADQILANLRNRNNIVAARIFKNDLPFASYLREDASPTVLPMVPEKEKRTQKDGKLEVFQKIRFRADNIGVLYMQSDLQRVYYRLRRYVGIVLLVMGLLVPLVFVISRKFQKVITEPIQKLAGVAHEVAFANNYSVRAEPQGDDEVGRLTRTFNYMLDTIQETNSRLVESNQKLVEQAEALWRSNKELEQFAYISSHDLQEPLRKIITYSQLLEMQFKNALAEEGAQFISNIVVSASRMQTLIKDLLAYSRLSKQEVKAGPVDLNLIVRNVLNDMETSIQESGATVKMDALPTVQSNPSQMHQLFQNLLGNAIKFHGAKPPVVRISAEKKGDRWIFGVHDNGIGIDPRYKDQIFKVFQRLHGKDSYPGTGIGLAICKKIVEQAGGEIWVDSEINQGSNFFFTWPA